MNFMEEMSSLAELWAGFDLLLSLIMALQRGDAPKFPPQVFLAIHLHVSITTGWIAKGEGNGR